MPEPTDHDEPAKPFLDVREAEIVHGPDVIADKVSGALRDADRFDLPSVKPPLSEALGKIKPEEAAAAGPSEGAPEQDALSGVPAEVDEAAGSAEVLKPAEKPTAA